MNILIFSLGEKGFSVVQALNDSKCVGFLECVIGQDKGVHDDYSLKLAKFCDYNGISYTFRNNCSFVTNDYDLFMAVGWRWMVRDIPKEKLIIFHDSLLPKYRGFAPLVNALLNKESVTGITALLGADDYDKGNILLQHTIDLIYPTCVADEIHRISHAYANMAVELIAKLDNGSINRLGHPQDEKEATYSLWRDDEDYRINWNDDAENISHFINCLGRPYRGASAVLNGESIRINKAMPRVDVKIENRTPGKVIFYEVNFPVVVCGFGLLLLTDVRNNHDENILPLESFRSRFY